ncbi:YbaK/prolyl-tRNA synthetase associated domain-containing protein [Citrobacter sp. JGM124]|uniref:YbaK/prolyl-tRNA synthetase associated domain-containing protein n=1 Tax=Citrobacter sp. JGM124 TaxID=2799789 RepID=UPI001BA72531|nr:YbaK/prolyl-tRNA synthetase associated domain-containing protein [Citrobacter sp. JGM124]MBS0847559.1 YbaK/prolyl-tRNA synthetase associated domain-containing protein [Citrobacter sp. JGM124]
MTTDNQPISIHQQLVALLNQEGASYRLMQHPTAGKCEDVSLLRGTALGQGAKALVCKIKGQGVKQHVLAVLSAEKQADLTQVAHYFSASKASLASPLEVDTLTRCVFGAIPPFSFHPELKLIADPYLFENYDEIAFNAGSLESSIILRSEDYLRIARPTLVTFHRQG